MEVSPPSLNTGLLPDLLYEPHWTEKLSLENELSEIHTDPLYPGSTVKLFVLCGAATAGLIPDSAATIDTSNESLILCDM